MILEAIEKKLSDTKEKIKEMANDPYKEIHEERLNMRDKEGKLLYEKKGKDIVRRNGKFGLL
jgi:hypothetical protein